MHMIPEPNKETEFPTNTAEPSRRAVLVTAATAAAAVTGVPGAISQTVPSANYGAPLVEMSFPVGVLSLEQKAAMIKAVTDVIHSAMKLTPDPAKKLFVEIFETPEGGFGVNGQVVVPRGK
jgi:phenylpyruvate tautomerase PptA (4-oxalocrotonate tautomerase family)